MKPFKGLRPYSERDAQIFFGRKEEVGKVLGYLRTRRLTILHGESGVGKTSLLRAGVARHVKLESKRNVDKCGYPKVAVVIFPDINKVGAWLDNPLDNLKLQIQKYVTKIDSTIPIPVKDLPFVETLTAWTDWLGGGEETGELFIILDHFEEFLERRDKDVGSEFSEAFAEAANCRDLMVNFLVALQSSSFASLGQLEGAIPKIMANHIKLQPLSKESARRAIMGPVKVYNKKREEAPEVKLDDELADTILEAVNASQIEMPYLELILEHLWENRLKQANATVNSLSLEKKDLDDIGGAEGLLKQHLKQQLAHIRPKQQETAQEMFRYLVTPSSRNTIPQTAEDLAEFIIAQSLEKSKLQVAEINKLLKNFSKPDVRLLKRLTENRYEVYFPRLARVIADWLKSERRIQRLNDEGEAALREFEYSQLYALKRVYSALKDYQSELETRDVEERKAFPYPSAMMISQALVWMLSEIRERRIYCHEKGAIFGVSFSPDGLLATCSLDGTLAIWDVNLLDEGPSMAVQGGDGFDLRLMSSLNDVSGIPTEGKNLIVVVAVDNALHFRIFDGDGKVVVDTDEKKLTEQARQIEDLKRQLESLWPPHELTTSDKGWVITAVASIVGHTSGNEYGMFWDVAFAPDGTKLATASWDNTVIIWDFTSKQLARPFPLLHDAPVYCVAFSEDSQRLAAGSSNGTVCLWNLDEKINKRFSTALGPVSRVSFRPDGKALAAASWNYKARVWDLEGRPKSETLEGVCALAFSQDGCLATGSVDGFIRLWNEDGKEYKKVQEVKAHADSRICHISFDANGQQLATVSWDGTAKLWNLGYDLRLMSSLNDVSGIPTEGKNLIVVVAVNNALHFRIFDGDGKVVVDTDEKKLTEQVRQIEDLKKQLESLWPPHELTTSDKGWVITAVTSIVGYTRNLQKPEGTLSILQPPEIVRLSKHVIYRVAITADRKLMTTASSDGAAHQWELDRQRAKFAKCQIIRSKDDKVRFFGTSFSPDGQELAIASSDNIARLWKLEGNELPPLKGHCGPVYRVNFSGNGEYLVTASADKTARLWKRDGDGKSVKEFSHSMSVYCACFSPDGDRVATASEDGFVCIWDLEGNKIHQFPHPGPVYYAWFSPHGEWLATASADGRVRLWNPQERHSQQPLKHTRGNKCPVFCVSFRNDGKQLASVSGDGYMRLWDLPGNRRGGLALQTEFRVHPGLVFGVSYAPDSSWLATSSYDGSVRLWSAEGKQLAEFKEHIGPVYSVAVSCNGKKLATSSFDGSVIVRQIVHDTSVLEELLADAKTRLDRAHETD